MHAPIFSCSLQSNCIAPSTLSLILHQWRHYCYPWEWSLLGLFTVQYSASRCTVHAKWYVSVAPESLQTGGLAEVSGHESGLFCTFDYHFEDTGRATRGEVPGRVTQGGLFTS